MVVLNDFWKSCTSYVPQFIPFSHRTHIVSGEIPACSMPSWAYLTTYVNPMHYFIDAIRTVFVRGGTFQHIAYQVYALFAISFFMAFWAVRSYRKNN